MRSMVGGVASGGMILAAAGALSSCDQWTIDFWRPNSSERLPPVSDRIRAAYADAAGGRFITVADFESLEQSRIFHLENPAREDSTSISVRRSRPETGAGALHVPFGDNSDVLVCRDSQAAEWSLTRDWSDYYLLLASVYSPREGVVLEFAARSGQEPQRAEYLHPKVPLRAGWNLLRLDVSDMADWIDLRDVRELRISCADLDAPVELFFDDLILTDNRRTLLGSPDSDPGQLYVRQQGRRLLVGSSGQFELVFSRGRLVQWFDLGHDPDRAQNLAGRGGLGPLPVVVQPQAARLLDPEDQQQWSPLGSIIQSRQTLREASPVRVVIDGEWSFLSPDRPEPDEETPRHRTIFTIYPQGRIFVQLDWSVASDTWQAEHVGLVLSTNAGRGFRHRHLPAGASASSSGSAELPGVVHARGLPSRADLLFVLHEARVGATMQSAVTEWDSRLSTLILGLEVTYPRSQFTGLIVVWPPDLDREAHAMAVVDDYRRPAQIIASPSAGQVVRTDAGDANNDGFNEATGCYVLALEENLGRFTFQTGGRLRFYPCFKVIDTADRDVWVYVDGRHIRKQARNADGACLFQIPAVLDRDVLVEIHAAGRSDPLSLNQ